PGTRCPQRRPNWFPFRSSAPWPAGAGSTRAEARLQRPWTRRARASNVPRFGGESMKFKAPVAAGALVAGAAVLVVHAAEAKTPTHAKPTGDAAAPTAAPAKDLDKLTTGLTRRDGLLPVYVDAKQGKIYLALPAPDAEGVAGRFIYMASLKTGLGSAPIGLDR